MKNFFRKHSILVFYVVTFLFTPIFSLINVYVFPSAHIDGVIFPQFVPGIVAIILIRLTEGNIGIRKLLLKFKVSREIMIWLIITIVIPIAMVGISYLLLSVIDYGYIKKITLSEASLPLLIGTLICSIGEEIGWRGYMLPKLQSIHSPFISSVILGLFWGIWHFKFQYGLIGFLLFILIVIELSILFTWLSTKTNGNLIIATIFHAIFNFTTTILLSTTIGIKMFAVEVIVFGIFCIIVLLVSGWGLENNKLYSST
ncbi:type II CAAX endopeptidase family protein [Abyssisolibacter fermentans]|uniref:type II CAAX endopeptidase family protein n=1 Tax=Abyssisolibacter fermentans TaxID=1766203 RepID=UPI00083503A2|nr:type II CAAX endopeptidase family protein [Abyssisolibacter fermentans]